MTRLTDGLICQRCNGLGTVGPVHINKGDAPHEWRMMRCDGCNGSGYWTAAQAIRARDGEAMRAARVERGETLRMAARRMGITPSQLSAIECGRVPFRRDAP